MANKGKNTHHGQRHRKQSSVARENACTLSEDSPVLSIFLQASIKLTDRQDRHERLVKLSRDITIESKRIIFLLHSAVTKEKTKEMILEEAKQRLLKLINGPIRTIAIELENKPAYLHTRAVTAGLQEFIEAKTFYSLMDSKQIITYNEVKNEFVHNLDENKTVATLLPYTDYMLGIADLTGELMRKALNSITSGDSEECFFACDVIRQLYAGFLGVTGAGSLIYSKLSTTRSNVHKVEGAVFALRVRGGEAPPPLILPCTWETQDHEQDEGFF